MKISKLEGARQAYYAACDAYAEDRTEQNKASREFTLAQLLLEEEYFEKERKIVNRLQAQAYDDDPDDDEQE